MIAPFDYLLNIVYIIVVINAIVIFLKTRFAESQRIYADLVHAFCRSLVPAGLFLVFGFWMNKQLAGVIMGDYKISDMVTGGTLLAFACFIAFSCLMIYDTICILFMRFSEEDTDDFEIEDE